MKNCLYSLNSSSHKRKRNAHPFRVNAHELSEFRLKEQKILLESFEFNKKSYHRISFLKKMAYRQYFTRKNQAKKKKNTKGKYIHL